ESRGEVKEVKGEREERGVKEVKDAIRSVDPQGRPEVETNALMRISAKTGDGLEELKERFIAHVRALDSGESDIVVTNARHVEALTHARAALLSARQAVADAISGELLATDLRQAQYYLGAITGKITVEDLLGSIFSRFCIGK